MISKPSGILFLDIDGVIIPFGKHSKWAKGPDGNTISPYLIDRVEADFHTLFAPSCKQLIRDFCEGHNLAIVVNSTHNGGSVKRPGAYHVFDMFKKNGMEDLLYDANYRTTFCSDDDAFQTTDRARACWMWIYKHGKIPFVALDDNVNDFKKWNEENTNAAKSHYVQVNSRRGVNFDNMDRASRILLSQVDV